MEPRKDRVSGHPQELGTHWALASTALRSIMRSCSGLSRSCFVIKHQGDGAKGFNLGNEQRVEFGQEVVGFCKEFPY